jgi:hypothetical protein
MATLMLNVESTVPRTIYQFPKQQIPYAEKDEPWGKDNIDAGIMLSNHDHGKIRKSRAAKKINYDIINGIIDESDIELAFNPLGLKGVKFPAKIQNYPIETGKLNVLKGEEGRRRFDWRLRTLNEDAISERETDLSEQIMSFMFEQVANENYTEEQARRRMRNLQKYQNYDYQDMREKAGTRVLSYFWHTKKMRRTFNDSFWDMLIAGEEIFSCFKVHGEPEPERLNPLNVTAFGMGESYKFEDADVITIDGYHPIGKMIDEYWDVLKPNESAELEMGSMAHGNYANRSLTGPIQQDKENRLGDAIIIPDSGDIGAFGGYYDSDGNVRRTITIWKSRRKIGTLTYFEDGIEYKTYVDEYYKPKEDKGESVEWTWINEWWWGHKIGPNLYKRIEPLPRIGNKMNNPSFCLPPIIGTLYKINSNESISLVDRIIPYKYLYNIYMRRTELSSARNKGVLAEMDLAKIPEGWTPEVWMLYAEMNGFFTTDSFKQGSKGAATGRLVQNLNNRGNQTMDLNSSDVIKANLELAIYVKNELGEIMGISPQREGSIENRETVGGVERAVQQSAYITEEWFMVHDNTKLRLMELVLETAKYCWLTQPTKKLQYIDDGLITHTYNIDTKLFAETEYGLFMSDGSSDSELFQTIKQLAHAAMQNDKARISDVLSIFSDMSISSARRKLEASEDEAFERQEQSEIRAVEAAKITEEGKQRLEQMKLQQEERIELAKLQNDLLIAQLEIQSKLLEAQHKSANDKTAEKLVLEYRKQLQFIELEREKLRQKSDENEKKIRSQERISRNQLKVQRQRSSSTV